MTAQLPAVAVEGRLRAVDDVLVVSASDASTPAAAALIRWMDRSRWFPTLLVDVGAAATQAALLDALRASGVPVISRQRPAPSRWRSWARELLDTAHAVRTTHAQVVVLVEPSTLAARLGTRFVRGAEVSSPELITSGAEAPASLTA